MCQTDYVCWDSKSWEMDIVMGVHITGGAQKVKYHNGVMERRPCDGRHYLFRVIHGVER